MASPTSPPPSKRHWRAYFLLVLVALALIGLGGHAFYLQVVRQDFLEDKGKERYQRTLTTSGIRGRILDRNGSVLAFSASGRAIWLDSQQFASSTPAQSKKLGEVLDMDAPSLHQALKQKNFYLKRQLPVTVAEQVRALNIPGVYFDEELRRLYPEGETVAALLGFTNIDHRGVEGVEKGFDDQLKPQKDVRRVIKDRNGRVVEGVEELQQGEDGRDVMLTIDSRVQYQAYSQLKAVVENHAATGGTAIVVDVSNGDILALANYNGGEVERKAQLDVEIDSNNRRELLRNHAFLDIFEPGSTMKPFAAAMAIEAGTASPNSVFNTNDGKLTIGSKTISDDEHLKGGRMTLTEIIQKSSNVGIALAVRKLSSEKMWKTYQQLGFGKPLNITYPGLARGTLRPSKAWQPIDKATISFGHGMSTSLAQLAQAYTVFALDGVLRPLRLFIDDSNRQLVSQPMLTTVISANTARQVRAMLELAASEKGTGARARVPGYRIAGKTGTARKYEKGGYVRKYISSFVGMVPASQPRFLMAVMVDNPRKNGYYGSDVAAPVFAATMEFVLHYYGIPGDAPSAPPRAIEVKKVVPVGEKPLTTPVTAPAAPFKKITKTNTSQLPPTEARTADYPPRYLQTLTS